MLDQLKAFGDVASFYIAVGTLVNLLPPLAAAVSIAWIGFQFYHSTPVKEWRAQRKERNGNS